MAYTVLVTGASGYIATELVKQLLEKGYNVRGTVRSVSDPTKTEPLTLLGNALPGAPDFSPNYVMNIFLVLRHEVQL